LANINEVTRNSRENLGDPFFLISSVKGLKAAEAINS
jgi:hypothetical protein